MNGRELQTNSTQQAKDGDRGDHVIAAAQNNAEEVPAKRSLTFAEIVADLKNHDKDASATPEAFLASITCFAVRMEEEIAWYAEEYYQPVFPRLSSEQMEQLHDVVRRIGAAAEHIYSQVKKYRKKGSST